MAEMTLACANGANRKAGPGVATTYRPVGATCPPDCGMLDACYAIRDRVAMWQHAAAGRNDQLHILAGNTLVRHLVSGDMFRRTANGRSIVDRELIREMIALHNAAPWLTGWTYTHGAERVARAGFGPETWPQNLTVLASCETIDDAHRLQSQGWRTARVIDEPEDIERGEFLCPYDAAKRGNRPKTTCARCQACFRGTRNIAFLRF